jgi:hypothetical protein
MEWTSSCADSGQWISPATVFAQLGQILADAYAERLGNQRAACEEVIRRLGQLITEAYTCATTELGTCTLSFTSPPTPIRMSNAECDQLPASTWEPD